MIFFWHTRSYEYHANTVQIPIIFTWWTPMIPHIHSNYLALLLASMCFPLSTTSCPIPHPLSESQKHSKTFSNTICVFQTFLPVFKNSKSSKNTFRVFPYICQILIFPDFFPWFFPSKKKHKKKRWISFRWPDNCTKKLARPQPLCSQDMNSAKSVAASGVIRICPIGDL